MVKCTVNCCVYGCNSRCFINGPLSFFHFPKPGKLNVLLKKDDGSEEIMDRCAAWIYVLKFPKELKTCTRVCELHFNKRDFVATTNPSRRKILKKFAVPSCHLPEPSAKVIKQFQKRKDLERRKIDGLVLPPGRNKKKQPENKQEPIIESRCLYDSEQIQIAPGTSSEMQLPIQNVAPQTSLKRVSIRELKNTTYYEIPETMVYYYELEEIVSEPEKILPK